MYNCSDDRRNSYFLSTVEFVQKERKTYLRKTLKYFGKTLWVLHEWLDDTSRTEIAIEMLAEE